MVAGSGSVTDKFKMVRDAGFDGIELNLPDDGLTTEMILEAKKASGIEVAGIIAHRIGPSR
jgi:hexulose-6-phosphate isomerase